MNIIDAIGNTPLLKLEKTLRLSGIPVAKGVTIHAKAEFLNPSGSVKDRAAKAMLLDGITRGNLTLGKTIIDATSGNTGISYAMLGAYLGFPVKLFLPANASQERKAIMRQYNATIVETDPLAGSDGAHTAAQEEVAAHPKKYFYPNQYGNDENWRAHFNGTGEEIWRQTTGQVTHFVCAVGTTGTFTGVARRLKQYNKNVRVITVQPDGPFHGIEGTKHLASTIKPAFYDDNLPESTIEVNTEKCYAMARQLVAKEGLFVGISSAANILAAMQLAATAPENAVIVTILCDGGTRYLSDPFWNDEIRA